MLLVYQGFLMLLNCQAGIQDILKECLGYYKIIWVYQLG